MVDRLSKIDMPSIVPGGTGGELAPDPKDFGYYYDQAREICRRVKDKAHLTDDEIIVLAVVASQLALAKFVEPGERDSDATLNEIMTYLDHNEQRGKVVTSARWKSLGRNTGLRNPFHSQRVLPAHRVR